MAFTSELGDDLIINDETHEEVHQIPADQGTGLDLSERGGGEYEYGSVADPFPSQLLIARSEWQARIQEIQANQSAISDQIKLAGLPPKNQAQTLFCWGNAPTHCLEINRVQQNQPMVILSPASVCAQINGFKNKGGWGKQALQWISDNGVVPVDQWPANAIDRKYATAENKTLALDYRTDEWIELAPNNLDQMVSLLLRRIPIAVGLSWWGHEVTFVDALWIDGAIAIRGRNSWGADWPKAGASGFFVLQGQKMLPNDAVAPATAIAS